MSPHKKASAKAIETEKGLLDSKLFKKIITIRRDLHQHPELSWQEKQTSRKVCRFLKSLNISYRSNIAKTGIVAEIPGKKGAPFIALRADIDALPIKEETGVSFASVNEGVMHACGHDGHTAMLLGAAVLLSREKELPAPVRLIFQPAEEKAAGAKAMIQEGVLNDVAMIFGGHLDRHYKTGRIVVTEGGVNASSDHFYIKIAGQGSHGARPHESVDAVVVGSLMVMALQTIVSREVDPARPSVISVGLFQAGTASNVIAGQAMLEGTIRALDANVRKHLISALKRIAGSIARLHGAKIQINLKQGSPPVINRRQMTELAREAAILSVGEKNVIPLRTANMGAEDFGFYLKKLPGAYVRFGSQIEGLEGHPAHSNKFDFDEEALAVGATYYHAIAKISGEIVSKKTVPGSRLTVRKMKIKNS